MRKPETETETDYPTPPILRRLSSNPLPKTIMSYCTWCQTIGKFTLYLPGRYKCNVCDNNYATITGTPALRPLPREEDFPTPPPLPYM